MSLTIWIYRRKREGVLTRFPVSRFDRFQDGTEALPDQAGGDALFALLVIERENGEPVAVVRQEYTRIAADAEGYASNEQRLSIVSAMSSAVDLLENLPSEPVKSRPVDNVVRLGKQFARSRLERISSWRPTHKDMLALSEEVNRRAGRTLPWQAT
jgi:hypothetical protein